MKRKGNPPQVGFTLIELLVTMGLIVLILAVSVPALAPFYARRALEGAVSRVKTTIELARINAVRTNAVKYFACQLVDKDRRIYRVTADYGSSARRWTSLPENVDAGIIVDSDNTYGYRSSFQNYLSETNAMPITALLRLEPNGSCYLVDRSTHATVSSLVSIEIDIVDLRSWNPDTSTYERMRTLVINRNTGRVRVE